MTLLAAFAYQLCCALLPLPFLNRFLLRMDDAYYYFQSARNFADHGLLSFDGIHRTSGVQLLWEGVLCGLALLVKDRVTFLHAILVLCALLNLGAGVAFGRLAGTLASRRVAALCQVLWAGFMVGLVPTMMGMEYSLQVLLLLLATGSAWRALHAAQPAPALTLLARGSLLGLLFWNRLDAALIAMALWAVMVWSARRTTGGSTSAFMREICLLSAPPAVAAIAYVVACEALAGTPTPISGAVKALYASRHFDAYPLRVALAGHVFWFVEMLLAPLVDLVSNALRADHRSLFGALGLLALGSTGLVLVLGLRAAARVPERRPLLRFLSFLTAVNVLHVAMVVLRISYFAHVTVHYYGFLLITVIIALAVALDALSTAPAQPSVRLRVLPAALLVLLGLHIHEAAQPFAGESLVCLHNRRLPVMQWVATHLPIDARIGAWNAGQLGYFTGHPVVNLDGLANDRSYLGQLRARTPVMDYLRAEHIDYLIDVDAPDLTFPYKAQWDGARIFRNAIPWEQLERLYVEPANEHPIVVARVAGARLARGDATR
ncbi:MAG TPA: hypothetical protein VF331_19315 [Polyangiales bacterium]